MLYRGLTLGRFDLNAGFQELRARSAEHFYDLANDLIRDRLAPQAWARELPHPLIFHFEDRDYLGRSDVLACIFDHSGEDVQRMSLEWPQRRRGLIADGYLLFCDPTRASEPQAKEVVDFAADRGGFYCPRRTRTRRFRNRAPVAICVPKIDLLPNVEPFYEFEGGHVDRFYHELSEIDEIHLPMSLERIRARSELVRRAWDLIWPGWRIESQIRNIFGDQYMFFPLTPVGLDCPGEMDLCDRHIEPYGVLEPLMWLLHMKGYVVLD
jgi:hypothetical protein